MQGTDIIIAMPRLIEKTYMQNFAVCPLPFKIKPLGFFMAWHLRNNLSPYHQWLRGSLKNIVRELKL